MKKTTLYLASIIIISLVLIIGWIITAYPQNALARKEAGGTDVDCYTFCAEFDFWSDECLEWASNCLNIL